MAGEKVTAVLFDLGETLLMFGRVKIGKLFSEAADLTYAFLKEKGQPVGNRFGYRFRNLFSIRLHYFLSKLTGNDFDSLELLKKLGSGMGINLSEAEWQQVSRMWYEPLSRKAVVESGVISTLTQLRNMGLKMGIVSNTFINAATLDDHLERFGLLEFFPLRMYSYQFDFRKPDSRIFLAAAERIGVEPANIMFVGDRLNEDVKGSIGVGMRAVLKTAYTNSGKNTSHNTLKIDRLSELPDIIQKINSKGK